MKSNFFSSISTDESVGCSRFSTHRFIGGTIQPILSLILILTSLTTFSQNIGFDSGITRAVIVGISDYQDENIPDLRFANRDAEAFAAFLQSPAGGEISKDNIQLLTNKSATTGAMAGAMDWLIEKSKEGDKAIIYFSGHGDVETRTRFQRGFLLTYDSPPSNYLAGAFALIFLQDIITTLAEQGVQVIMVSDACRAGKLAGSDIGGSNATATNLAKQFANEIKILSCQPNEFSLEGEQWGGGRGAFSFHLIEGLTGLADKNEDLQVNLLEINRFLEETVPAETAPQMQIPMVVGNKGTILAHVDVPSLARVKEQKENALAMISTIETKGFEEVILVGLDSIWQHKYEQFTAALDKKELLEPAGNNAYDLYLELSKVPELERLHGLMKRNLATALQDESQQAINAYLRADESEMAARSRGELKYTKFVRYLKKAADLLGEKHYMYKSLKAKQYYFDGVDIRVRYFERTFSLADSSEIWRATWREKIDTALLFEENAAFIINEYGLRFDLVEAIPYYEKALELAPNWAIPYNDLADRLRQEKDYEEAIKYSKKAAELAPNWGAPIRNLGRIFYQKKDFEKAEELFKKAINISPTNVSYLKTLGRFYRARKRYKEAEIIWLRALELSPNDNGLYNNLSQLYYSNTYQYDKAEAINLKRLEKRPTDGDAYADLISTYWGRDLEKIKLLIDKMKVINDSIEKWEGKIMIGKAYRALNLLEEAIPYYEEAIQDAPTSPWHYYSFAGVYRQLGDYEPFLLCLDTAFMNGMFYSWVEEHSGVWSAFKSPSYKAFAQKVIDARPEMGFGYSLMGKYYEGQNDYEKASDFYQNAIELSPEKENNWYQYGLSSYFSGLTEKSDSIFQEYYQLEKTSLRARQIAWEYHYHGAKELAEKYLRKALEEHPTEYSAYWDLAWLYFTFGEEEKAIQVMDEGIASFPNEFVLKGIRAMLLSLSNKSLNSTNAFEPLDSIRPGISKVGTYMKLLRQNDYTNASQLREEIKDSFSDWWIHRLLKVAELRNHVNQKDFGGAMDILKQRDPWIFCYPFLQNDAALAPLRETEEFRAYIRINFPEKVKNIITK